MHRTYIGLGSNLHEPLQQLQKALHSLQNVVGLKILQQSHFYQTPPLGALLQPDYINAVIELETTLSPHALLNVLQIIENAQGRVRNAMRWSARTLDLDILLYDQLILEDAILTIPHSGLEERDFVLYPLYELNPDLIFPNGKSLKMVIQNIPLRGKCLGAVYNSLG